MASLSSTIPLTACSNKRRKVVGATKAQLTVPYGNLCWNCEADIHLEVCHVITEKHLLRNDFRKYNLITFDSLDNYRNVIFLCPNCRVQFDHIDSNESSSPGFVFFPSDVEFFIDWERKDYQRREELTEDGSTDPPRQCSTADDYQNHQLSQGKISKTDVGGLYCRYYVRNHLPKKAALDLHEKPELKTWHGSPTATILRFGASFTFFTPGVEFIPEESRTTLGILALLYMRSSPRAKGILKWSNHIAAQQDNPDRPRPSKPLASHDSKGHRKPTGPQGPRGQQDKGSTGDWDRKRRAREMSPIPYDSAADLSGTDERTRRRKRRDRTLA